MRHSTINAVCGQQKGQNTAKSHVWLTFKKKLEFQFREFRDFSEIAENHWPYRETKHAIVGSTQPTDIVRPFFIYPFFFFIFVQLLRWHSPPSCKALARDKFASLQDWEKVARTGEIVWFYNGKKTGKILKFWTGSFWILAKALPLRRSVTQPLLPEICYSNI